MLVSLYHKRKLKKTSDKVQNNNSTLNKLYIVFLVASVICVTFFTATSLYQSAQAGQGQLYYYIKRYNNVKELKFINNNIYKDGLSGIFNPLEKKFDLPKELYIDDDFLVNYKNDGVITAFDGHFYGKNEKGESQSYLISYNHQRSNKMTVYLNNYYEDTYAEEKKLEPLFEIIKTVNLKNDSDFYLEDEYRLTYKGIFYRGYISKDSSWIDGSGNVALTKPKESGYTLNLYGKSRDSKDLLLHYIYGGSKTMTDQEFEAKWEAEKVVVEWKLGYNYIDGVESYFVDKNTGYQLSIVDAALGSRFYELLKTTDGGKSWNQFNQDPFLGETGWSAGITFIDDSLGFIALSH